MLAAQQIILRELIAGISAGTRQEVHEEDHEKGQRGQDHLAHRQKHDHAQKVRRYSQPFVDIHHNFARRERLRQDASRLHKRIREGPKRNEERRRE